MSFDMKKIHDFSISFDEFKVSEKHYKRKKMGFKNKRSLFYAPLIDIDYPLNNYLYEARFEKGKIIFKSNCEEEKDLLSFPLVFILDTNLHKNNIDFKGLEGLLCRKDPYGFRLDFKFSKHPYFDDIIKKDDLNEYAFNVPEAWQEDIDKLNTGNFIGTSDEYKQAVTVGIDKEILINEFISDFKLLMEKRTMFPSKAEEINKELLFLQKEAFKLVGVEEEQSPEIILTYEEVSSNSYSMNYILSRNTSYYRPSNSVYTISTNNSNQYEYEISASDRNRGQLRFSYELSDDVDIPF